MRRHEPNDFAAGRADDQYTKEAKPERTTLERFYVRISDALTNGFYFLIFATFVTFALCVVGAVLTQMKGLLRDRWNQGIEELWPNQYGYVEFGNDAYALIIYNESLTSHMEFLHDVKSAKKMGSVTIKMLDCDAHEYAYICARHRLQMGVHFPVKDLDWDDFEPAAVFYYSGVATESYHVDLKESKGVHSVASRPEPGHQRVEALAQWFQEAEQRSAAIAKKYEDEHPPHKHFGRRGGPGTARFGYDEPYEGPDMDADALKNLNSQYGYDFSAEEEEERKQVMKNMRHRYQLHDEESVEKARAAMEAPEAPHHAEARNEMLKKFKEEHADLLEEEKAVRAAQNAHKADADAGPAA